MYVSVDLNIDLAGHNIARLNLQLRLETDAATALNAWKSVGFESGHDSDDGSHHLEIAAYRRFGTDYDVLSHLTVSGDRDVRLMLDYSEGDGVGRNILRPNLSKIGAMLNDLASSCSVRCSATTTYDIETVRPLVGLPFMRFPSSQAFFDEIRGVRFVRLAENGDEVDNVALDIDGQGHLQIYTMTSFNDVSSDRISNIAMRRLVTLRARAVIN